MDGAADARGSSPSANLCGSRTRRTREIGEVGRLFKIVVMLELFEGGGLLFNGADGIVGQVFDGDGSPLQPFGRGAVF